MTNTPFRAGNIANHLESWIEITENPWIHNIIQHGLELEFINYPTPNISKKLNLSAEETLIIDTEINKLLDKKVIAHSIHEQNECISTLFTRPKKDGRKRMILNLKNLNENIQYEHFKMESIQSVIDLMEENCFMASVDLKDAYFSVPIHETHRKYLKFSHRDILYEFKAMPQGYGPAMRVFTKLLKAPFSVLRQLGFLSVIYVDDSFLQGESFYICLENVRKTIELLQKLGFTINFEKSILIPKQEITFLGLVFNSVTMTITLTEEKKEKIFNLCLKTINNVIIPIRSLASLIGNFTAAFPAIPFGKFYYRNLERLKTTALKKAKGNFDAKVKLTSICINELEWWLDNVYTSSRFIKIPDIDMTIFTDASDLGWGITNGSSSSGGRWSIEEKDKHINIRELKAVEIGIISYTKNTCPKHIRIMSDNTTAIAYINNMGGICSLECDELAKSVWLYCKSIGTYLSAAFIPGKENIIADKKSRSFNDAIEWQLNPEIFDHITSISFLPDIDLFASRINHQLPRYVSWHPDPNAIAIDAFSFKWNSGKYYIFPPFSIIGRVVNKIRREGTQCILIVPDWPSQFWYPLVRKVGTIVTKIFPRETNMMLPQEPNARHSLWKKLTLLVIRT